MSTLNDHEAVQALCTERIVDLLAEQIVAWIEADDGHWIEDPNHPGVYGYWSAEHERVVAVLYAHAGDMEVDDILTRMTFDG